MMWCEDYIDIQMVQSRLLLYTDGLWHERIAGDLFAKGADTGIYMPDTGLAVEGFDEIEKYYDVLFVQTLKNGKTLGTNQGTAQYIEIAPSGKTAVGRWYTYTVQIEGPAFGNIKPPYPYRLSVGKYENQFVKTDKGWRLKKLCWTPVLELEAYGCEPMPDGRLHKDADCWITPWPPYPHVRKAKYGGGAAAGKAAAAGNGVEDGGSAAAGNEAMGGKAAADDAWSRDVLAIQNLHGSFIHYWNTGRFFDIYEKLFARQTQDISFESQGFPGTLRGNSVRGVFEQMQRRAHMCGGFYGVQLSTSRVIEASPDGRHARGMWTSLTLDVRDIVQDNNGNHFLMDNATGRWYIDFIRENDGWKIKDYQWKAFAYMSPMEGRRVG